jgi:hypothetical protein
MLPYIVEEDVAPPAVPTAVPAVRPLSDGDVEPHNAPEAGVMAGDADQDGGKSESMGRLGEGEAIQAGWGQSPQPPKPGSGPMRPSVSASPRPATGKPP